MKLDLSKKIEIDKFKNLIYAYTSPKKSSYIPEFRDICLKFHLISSIKDNIEVNYEKINSCVEINKRVPSRYSADPEERRLCSILKQYRVRGHLHTEFLNNLDSLLDSLSISKKVHNVKQNYDLIINFIEINKRLPLQGSIHLEEKRLYNILKQYGEKKRRHNHEEFLIIVGRLITKHNIKVINVGEKYKSIITFIQDNKKKPSTISKNKHEKILGTALNNYSTGKQKHKHVEFIKQVEDLLKEINSEK